MNFVVCGLNWKVLKSLNIKPACQTVSNALSISMVQAKVANFLFKASHESFMNISMACDVLCSGLNPKYIFFFENEVKFVKEYSLKYFGQAWKN